MQKMLSGIDRVLAVLENSLIVVIVTMMVVLAFYQVVARNFFNTGLLWGDIFLRHLVLWVGFIGASLATREEKHIKVDVLTKQLSQRIQPYIRIIIDSVTLFVCLVLANAAKTFVGFEFEENSILFGDTPAWIFQIIIPVGFLMIAFRLFMKILQRISALISGEPLPEPENQYPA